MPQSTDYIPCPFLAALHREGMIPTDKEGYFTQATARQAFDTIMSPLVRAGEKSRQFVFAARTVITTLFFRSLRPGAKIPLFTYPESLQHKYHTGIRLAQIRGEADDPMRWKTACGSIRNARCGLPGVHPEVFDALVARAKLPKGEWTQENLKSLCAESRALFYGPNGFKPGGIPFSDSACNDLYGLAYTIFDKSVGALDRAQWKEFLVNAKFPRKYLQFIKQPMSTMSKSQTCEAWRDSAASKSLGLDIVCYNSKQELVKDREWCTPPPTGALPKNMQGFYWMKDVSPQEREIGFCASNTKYDSERNAYVTTPAFDFVFEYSEKGRELFRQMYMSALFPTMVKETPDGYVLHYFIKFKNGTKTIAVSEAEKKGSMGRTIDMLTKMGSWWFVQRDTKGNMWDRYIDFGVTKSYYQAARLYRNDSDGNPDETGLNASQVLNANQIYAMDSTLSKADEQKIKKIRKQIADGLSGDVVMVSNASGKESTNIKEIRKLFFSDYPQPKSDAQKLPKFGKRFFRVRVKSRMWLFADSSWCKEHISSFRPYGKRKFEFDKTLIRKLYKMRKDNFFPTNHERDELIKIQKLAVVPLFFWWSDNLVGKEVTTANVATHIKGADRLICKTGACDVSRVGFDAKGEVMSIICPQFGFRSMLLGAVNLEFTVTHCRGWIQQNPDGSKANSDMDINVEANLWINLDDGPPILPFMNVLRFLSNRLGYALPFSKQTAIKVAIDGLEGPGSCVHVKPGLMIVDGLPDYRPRLERHDVDFRLDKIQKQRVLPPEDNPFTGNVCDGFHLIAVARHKETIDERIQIKRRYGRRLAKYLHNTLLGVFNAASENIVADGQFLAWNLNASTSCVVDRKEYDEHSERMRLSRARSSLLGPYYRRAQGAVQNRLESVFSAASNKLTGLATILRQQAE